MVYFECCCNAAILVSAVFVSTLVAAVLTVLILVSAVFVSTPVAAVLTVLILVSAVFVSTPVATNCSHSCQCSVCVNSCCC